jgi:protein O-GlcNAc transferase
VWLNSRPVRRLGVSLIIDLTLLPIMFGREILEKARGAPSNTRNMSQPDLQASLQHHEAGRLGEAEAAYRGILKADPKNASALHLLGLLVHQLGRNEEALGLLRRSIQLSTFAPHFHSNLAGVLGKLGRPQEALEHLRAAVKMDPDFPQAHNNLGVVLETLGRYEEAVAAHQQAIRLNPSYVESLNNLGSAWRKSGALSESLAAHRRAIALRPDFADAYAGLAATFGEMGRVSETIAAYRRALAIRPEAVATHSDLLFTLHYDPAFTAQVLFWEHVNWADRHARRFYPEAPAPRAPDSNGRRLRVGYVSAHFRGHPVTRFFEPVLGHHDRRSFEVFCYSDVVDPDSATARLKAYGHVWRDVQGLRDERLAEIIREDRIDILVDLTGHMAGHRLLVFG